jgi:hypothetical protein
MHGEPKNQVDNQQLLFCFAHYNKNTN